MDIQSLLQKFLLGQVLILVPALMFIGCALKRTPHVANWLIPWLLMLMGIVGSLGILGFNAEAVLQGIIASGVAVFNHQLYRQSCKQD